MTSKDTDIFILEGLRDIRKTEYRYQAREINKRKEVNKKRSVT